MTTRSKLLPTAIDRLPELLRRWFSETGDVRRELPIAEEIHQFLRDHGVRSIAMSDRIIGCPHEEEIDYPLGESCPQCPFGIGSIASQANGRTEASNGSHTGSASRWSRTLVRCAIIALRAVSASRSRNAVTIVVWSRS